VPPLSVASFLMATDTRARRRLFILKEVAELLSFEPNEDWIALHTAARPFYIRAIFLMLALGTPDGLALRQEPAQRSTHSS